MQSLGCISRHPYFHHPLARSSSRGFDDPLDHALVRMNISENLVHVERRIGRVYKTKLIGVEAINSDRQMILFNQQYHSLRRNDDLAIIGDKAIDLELSIMWYRSRDSQGLHPIQPNRFSTNA